MTVWHMDTSRRGQVQLPPTGEISIYLVGTGGTGSFLAQSLARLAWHARTRGVQVDLTFVDPDRVEEKNVGRQLFCPAEIGQFKAETLAIRFNAAFGLRIRAVPQPVATLTREFPTRRQDTVLVMGAVDNHAARRDIHRLVAEGRGWWCDAGNEQVAGRVYMGNLDTRQTAYLQPGINAFGWCHGVPLPSLQDPGLLEPEVVATPTLSCADLTAQDAQSLMMNQMMAAVAAQYATDFVLHRRLTMYRSAVSLDPPTVVSALITEAALATLGVATLATTA